MSDPQAIEVLAAMTAPIMPITTGSTGRTVRPWTSPWPMQPLRRSREERAAIAADRRSPDGNGGTTVPDGT